MDVKKRMKITREIAHNKLPNVMYRKNNLFDLYSYEHSEVTVFVSTDFIKSIILVIPINNKQTTITTFNNLSDFTYSNIYIIKE
jgi:hypothetical protein